MGKQFYIYIVTNKTNTVLYTGVTSNLVKRIFEHKSGQIKGFTQKYKCNKLVYFEVYADSYTAIAREKSIKNLVRRKKIELIEKLNSDWHDLAVEILSPSAPEWHKQSVTRHTPTQYSLPKLALCYLISRSICLSPSIVVSCFCPLRLVV